MFARVCETATLLALTLLFSGCASEQAAPNLSASSDVQSATMPAAGVHASSYAISAVEPATKFYFKDKVCPNFRQPGGIIRFPESDGFEASVSYGSSNIGPRAPKQLLQISSSDFQNSGYPSPSGYTVDWYFGQFSGTSGVTFNAAQLQGQVRWRKLNPETQYTILEYVQNGEGQYVQFATQAVGKPVNDSLSFASPFENGFQLEYGVMFVLAHQ
jgi:hypothetical protein